ncbi:CYTH domain-containing protein [Listeria goaensis]|uniref:CYTH domain-containing protein n=1 Tax=Listeria goaensis TaxID=1649188 RepID=UPI000B5978A3|nr:CYTH domain-containing protein [Listeria goaensis]
MEELEIEFRNLLSENEYETLCDLFRLKETDFFEQTNYYLDTQDFALKQRLSALRIRQKGTHFEMTLKTPQGDGLLETSQLLGSDQAKAIFDGANIPTGPVRDKLATLNVSHEDLHYFGSLKTRRAEVTYKKGLLVFDKNFYGDKIDFDLEYEVSDFEKGQEIFNHFLEKNRISPHPALNKIERFYNYTYKSDIN